MSFILRQTHERDHVFPIAHRPLDRVRCDLLHPVEGHVMDDQIFLAVWIGSISLILFCIGVIADGIERHLKR